MNNIIEKLIYKLDSFFIEQKIICVAYSYDLINKVSNLDTIMESKEEKKINNILLDIFMETKNKLNKNSEVINNENIEILIKDRKYLVNINLNNENLIIKIQCHCLVKNLIAQNRKLAFEKRLLEDNFNIFIREVYEDNTQRNIHNLLTNLKLNSFDEYISSIEPEKKDILLKNYDKCLNGEEFSMNYFVKDGRDNILWMQEFCKPFGKTLDKKGYTSVIQDLTKVGIVKEMIEKVEGEHSIFMQKLPFGVKMIDKNGNNYFQNKAMENLIKKHRFNDENNEFIKSLISNFDNTVKNKTYKDNLYIKGEEEFVYEVETFPITRMNKVLFIVGLFRDISKEKKLENDLKDRHDRLGKILMELDETQRQLIQQEKLASVGQLAAGVAHEINNPLGFVMSNLDILKQYNTSYVKYIDKLENIKLKDGNEKELIEKAKLENDIDFILDDINNLFFDTMEGLRRIEKIVRSLRSFSRFEQEDIFKKYDLNQGIKDTLVIAKNEIKYDAEVITLFGDIPRIDAYGGLINQVLLNLLINGVHAIRDSEYVNFGKIEVETLVDGDYVKAIIKDNGCGISEENIERIFNPFFTTKAPGKGTGLGMSISYDIIANKHGGDIEVESKINEGTSVTIILPIEQSSKEG